MISSRTAIAVSAEVSSTNSFFSLKAGGGFIGLTYYRYLLIILLIIAVIMDFKYDRIFNGWIVFGILLGLYVRILNNGWPDIGNAVIAMLFAFCILYPIYKIGGLGAGDVKLFIMTGSFESVVQVLQIMVVSFIIGAVFSIIKMLSEENFKERMQYLLSYFIDVFKSGHWKLYGENLRDNYNTYKSNKIHFAFPVFLSVMLVAGGLY